MIERDPYTEARSRTHALAVVNVVGIAALLFVVHPGLAAAWALLVFAWLTR